MKLEGRTAVVTGGGRGIGECIARALASSGAPVVLMARHAEEVESVAASLRAEGRKAWGVAGDVTDPESVTRAARTAHQHLGRVDILVNNAGAAHSSPVTKITLEDWDRLFAVNATGTLLCTQAFLPGMMERGWGRIINIASVSGLTASRYIAAYAAAKHAVLGFTRALAAEVAASGITANAICPAYVNTAMTRESVARIVARTGRSSDEALAAILATTPQERLIEPEEVAHAVLYLAGPDARGVNGEALVIDGGKLLR